MSFQKNLGLLLLAIYLILTGLTSLIPALAFPALPVILAILENYQRADGRVDVPEALRPLMGKDVIENK